MRTGRDLPFGWTGAPAFHPDFGYLCPSPNIRRIIFASVSIAALGLAVGAMTAAHGFGQGGTGGQQVRLSQSVAERTTIPIRAVLPVPATVTVSKGALVPKHARIDCKGVFGVLFDSTCSPRSSRAAQVNRIAIVTEQPKAIDAGSASTSPITQPAIRPTAASQALTMARAGTRKPSRRIATYAYPPVPPVQLSGAPRTPTSAQASTRKPIGSIAAYAYAYAPVPSVQFGTAPRTSTLVEAGKRKPSVATYAHAGAHWSGWAPTTPAAPMPGLGKSAPKARPMHSARRF
jgi:hypothetical protein